MMLDLVHNRDDARTVNRCTVRLAILGRKTVDAQTDRLGFKVHLVNITEGAVLDPQLLGDPFPRFVSLVKILNPMYPPAGAHSTGLSDFGPALKMQPRAAFRASS